MNALILQWYDAGQQKTEKISEHGTTKNQGTVRIGRDPLRCDIILSHPTVSGLHIEIFFNQQQLRFFVRNLREQNPPLVNGQQLIQGELPLTQGSIIILGKQELKVTAISISSVPETIIAPPQPSIPSLPQVVSSQPTKPPVHEYHHPYVPPVQQQQPYIPPVPVQQPQGVYGLECPKCHKVSSAEHLQVGCRWCGTSLAAAVSVLVMPGN